MPITRRSGIAIHYEVAGEGPPMILVHANPFDHRLWMYQIARFSRWFRVIAMDIRGYGRSDKIETPFPFDEMVADLRAVLDEEKASGAILMGISVGSRMVMKAGLTWPKDIPAVIAVGSGSAGRGAHFDRRIAGYESGNLPEYHARHLRELVAPGFPETPRGRYLLSMFSEADPTLSGRAIAQGFRALAVAGIEEEVKRFTTPVLVINGAHDNALPRGREMAETLPNGEHVMIPATGHACCLEDPEAFDAAVIAFLRRHGLMPAA